MPIFELINPSDPYTFEAPDIKVAGAAVVLLSDAFGACRVGDGVDESTPVLFGWDDWLLARNIDQAWCEQHTEAIAAALDSFMIGGLASRRDALGMLAEVPPEKREAWRARRQDRHRSSVNAIGEAAYRLAARLRKRSQAAQGNPKP